MMDAISIQSATLLAATHVVCLLVGAIACHMMYRRQDVPWSDTCETAGAMNLQAMDMMQKERAAHDTQQSRLLDAVVHSNQLIATMKVQAAQPIMYPMAAPDLPPMPAMPVPSNGEPRARLPQEEDGQEPEFMRPEEV